jgi:DNA-binding CsgD family transcriptional regulator
LSLLGEVVGLLDLEEFRSGLLRGVRGAVPVDWISLNDLSPDPAETVVLVEPGFPPEAHALYARYALENPLVTRYQATQDGRCYRFSDVTTEAELHATALYREFYEPIGLRHQLAFTLPGTPGRLLALALSRRESDFTDEERALLEQARPFLIQAYRNACEHTRLRAELAVRSHGRRLPLEDPALRAELSARGITPRESEILSWLSTGRTNRALADLLGLSERTVQKHLQHGFAKLGVHGRGEAVELLWSWAAANTAGDAQLPAAPALP